MDLISLVSKAKTSAFYLWILNVAFNRLIPFNRPHGFRIVEVDDFRVRTSLPYKRANLNHLRGLHACALATLTEITGGFLLAVRLDPKRYRIILKRLEVDYLYQGKTQAFGELVISPDWLQQKVVEPLRQQDAVEVVTEVSIKDATGNALTSGRAIWQVKDWQKVKTKPGGSRT